MRLSVWVGLALLLGCVNGGDDSTGKPQGSLGGPCYANNTCDTNLSCVLESGKGICEAPDGTVLDAPTNDQASPDTGVDAGMDASDACTATPTPTMPCPTSCLDAGAGCCAENAKCVATAALCGTNNPWTCQTKSECSSGTATSCCLDLSLNTTTCPPSAQIPGGKFAGCQTACNANQYEVCMSQADCTGPQKCVGTSVAGLGSALGICL